MCLLVTEFRFDAMLCSNLGKENSDAGHINCSRGLQVPHPCFMTAVLVFFAALSVSSSRVANLSSPKKPDLVPKIPKNTDRQAVLRHWRIHIKQRITKHKIDIKTGQKHQYNTILIFRNIFFPRNYTVVHLFLIKYIEHFWATVKSLQYSLHPAWS